MHHNVGNHNEDSPDFLGDNSIENSLSSPNDVLPRRVLRRVHFIGIAGSGMAGIAYVAHKNGIKVSGSDHSQSSYVQPLLEAGVEVCFEHRPGNLADPDIELVVASTAIPSTNPELIAAHERGLEVWPRARMLAYLGYGKQVLAVSGTHGKTTSSSMLATALVELDANPSFLIGGVLNAYNTSSQFGSGPYTVMEADESDSSFTWLDPRLTIITNIEADHMDHYQSLAQIKQSFLAFLEKLDPQGIAVICADDPGLVELVKTCGKPFITYGSTPQADVYYLPSVASVADAANLANSTIDGSTDGSANMGVTAFDVVFNYGPEQTSKPDSSQLPEPCSRYHIEFCCSPGLHNMLNATAVMAALDWLDFGRQESAKAISKFQGAHRRFDRIGEAAGVLVVDDYGHHPTEIAATLAAAKTLNFSDIHLLFQPHRFTRTQAFITEFGAAFDDASTISLMEIYTAGETPIAKIDSSLILKTIKQHKPTANVRLLSKREQIANAMANLANPGSVVITMGAGDVTNLAPEILAKLQEKAAS